MEYRQLGKGPVKVSALCLGTMTWGEQNSQQEAHEQLDLALDHDINFIDTAQMYPVPPRPETQGRTEQFIGTWGKWKQKRDRIILASKISGPGMNLREDLSSSCFSRQSIRKALEDSLRRLNTDYIDLYQLHWPERTTNRFGQRGLSHIEDEEFTPLENILRTLHDLQQEGKIRQIGISNETPWGMMEYLKISERTNLPRMASVQNPYNLLNRTFEMGMAEIALRESCGLLAYSPLAFGVLSGKYLGGKQPSKARLTLFPSFSRYSGVNATKAVKTYVELAKKYSISPVAMALGFITSRAFVTSNIIGATTNKQLRENISHAQVSLPKELLLEVDRIHQDNPNPAP